SRTPPAECRVECCPQDVTPRPFTLSSAMRCSREIIHCDATEKTPELPVPLSHHMLTRRAFTRRTFTYGAPLVIGLLALPARARAQGWPSRPIKLVVPTGPGAATDVMARLLSEGLSRGLGQAVVVENQPGASGILAHQTVARAAADGYTFLFTN